LAGSQSLIVRFATDLEPAKRGLADLAQNAYSKFSSVKEAAELAARGLEYVAQSSVKAGKTLNDMSGEAHSAASNFAGANDNINRDPPDEVRLGSNFLPIFRL
jgi:hypothetical protein